MAKQAKGMKSITNLAFEKTYGQMPSDGIWYQQPINKNALTGKQSLIQSNTITGRRDMTEPGIGQMDASGQLELPLDVRNIGNILKGLFGAPTTTAGTKEGTYKHVFKVADEIPSLTIEKGFPISAYSSLTPVRNSINFPLLPRSATMKQRIRWIPWPAMKRKRKRQRRRLPQH